MRKKLWFLNLLLLGGIALVGREIHENWKSAREREKNMLSKPVKPAPAPPVVVAPPPAPLQAAGYLDVAQQMLFSKDRNPNIPVEAPPVKVVPPFPKFFGVMNLGDGPMAILSDGPGKQRPFLVGEKTGELKLVEIGTDTLVFEWDGKRLPKKFSEMMDRTEVASGDTTPRGPTTPAAPPPPPPPSGPVPGVSMGAGMSACNPGDTSPAGTVVNGMRKVITETPFSKVCRWEAVK